VQLKRQFSKKCHSLISETTLYKEARYAVRIALTPSTAYPVKYTSLMDRNLPKSQACKKEHHYYQSHKATQEEGTW
jgi:hypothetical protein